LTKCVKYVTGESNYVQKNKNKIKFVVTITMTLFKMAEIL